MSARPRTLLVARDPGAANALAPVSRSGPSVTVGLGWARAHFAPLGVACGDPDEDDDPGVAAKTIDRVRPEVLLTGTSLQVEADGRWWDAARARGVPSVALLDQWVNYHQRFTVARPFDRMPDQIAVMDERARARMHEEGCPPARLVVVGQPAFDELFEGAPGDRAAARSSWGVGDRTWVVLFASEPVAADSGPAAPFTETDCLELLLGALGDARVHVVVKLHPRESPDRVKPVLARARVPTTLVAGGSPRAAMAGADTVVGITSIFLVEAAIAGLPVLSVQPVPGGLGAYADHLHGLVPVASTREAVRDWLSSPENRAPLTPEARARRSAASGLRPGAAERVWDHLAAMVRLSRA